MFHLKRLSQVWLPEVHMVGYRPACRTFAVEHSENQLRAEREDQHWQREKLLGSAVALEASDASWELGNWDDPLELSHIETNA